MSSGPSSQTKPSKKEEENILKSQDISPNASGLSAPETIEQIRERCKQRIDDYKKAIKKTMPLSD
jgi:hypothetical protein